MKEQASEINTTGGLQPYLFPDDGMGYICRLSNRLGFACCYKQKLSFTGRAVRFCYWANNRLYNHADGCRSIPLFG